MLDEEVRLEEDRKREKNWKRWGPYLSERQWATVREDYSPNGDSWNFFPHDHARSRAYRWGEDGLLGITDREGRLCFALALWNGKDPILKERLFGLTSTQGNHGEDVKECYYYLDSTPTHTYMKALYKYPQSEYPYDHLIEENQKRGLLHPEYELIDTGIFDQNRYFDVFVHYAKESPNDILIQIEIFNRGAEEASVCVLPTLWYRNSWCWGTGHEGCTPKLEMRLNKEGMIETTHPTLGHFFLAFENPSEVLFTDNETDLKRLFGVENTSHYLKDAFHEYLIKEKKEAINPEQKGSKAAPLYRLNLKGGERKTLHLRLFSAEERPTEVFGKGFDDTFLKRKQEADAFYKAKIPEELSDEEKKISRQSYAGLLWSKQFYHYIIEEWLKGDPNEPIPPAERYYGRNNEWTHFFARDVISMPDKWEYPWFAAWDLAFHMIPFTKIDPTFAKKQMILFLREWYMHPNGQQPAYEFGFSDVNPPVHAWACWRIYKMTGRNDILFLESAFQKLLLNFTWWVNRKDVAGNHIFGGGFLGLDNIGVFDRSKGLKGHQLEQADGTAWMAFYCLTMLRISLELAFQDPVYEDMASKFFEHFIHIADAMNEFKGTGLWNEEDGFYYDRLKMGSSDIPLKTRSLVGMIPLIAVEVLEEAHLKKLKGFSKRMEWFINNRGDLEDTVIFCDLCPYSGRRILAIPSKERLKRMLRYVLDESEFLSPYGLRSLSKVHEKNPYVLIMNNEKHVVDYVPGEGNSYMFGGNSNWRGPIWFPLNCLIIDALKRYQYFYGEGIKVEYPLGSGRFLNLKEVSIELNRRLIRLFLPNEKGQRPCHGQNICYAQDPHWKDLLLFNEYYHADTGKGLGASHQTGWTALISQVLEEVSIETNGE